MPSAAPSLGDHLRAWRRQRRMSQLDLAPELFYAADAATAQAVRGARRVIAAE